MAWQGKAKFHSFKTIYGADRDLLASGPLVLLVKRRATGFIVGMEAFDIEDRTRLNAWIERAAVVSGIELQAYLSAGSRVDRAAVVADLSRQPARASRFIAAGKFDLRAIMTAAYATARTDREASGRAWIA